MIPKLTTQTIILSIILYSFEILNWYVLIKFFVMLKGKWYNMWRYAQWMDIKAAISHQSQFHDDVKLKDFRRYWPFVRGIHRSPVNSPHKGQWRGALMFSLICAWINGWVNNREAGDLRRHRGHYYVNVMCIPGRIIIIMRNASKNINQLKSHQQITHFSWFN